MGEPPVTTLILARGPFVTPQELATDSAADLTSSSSSTLTHGFGNTVLTLTGANFLPGVAVTWNGSYRTTTVVDPSHVTSCNSGERFGECGKRVARGPQPRSNRVGQRRRRSRSINPQSEPARAAKNAPEISGAFWSVSHQLSC